jgi:uncharacterized protein
VTSAARLAACVARRFSSGLHCTPTSCGRSTASRPFAVFGSVARDEARTDSDVDVLVEFSRPTGLIGFNRIQIRLEQILGTRVDLTTRAALRESMRDEILREAIRAA